MTLNEFKNYHLLELQDEWLASASLRQEYGNEFTHFVFAKWKESEE